MDAKNALSTDVQETGAAGNTIPPGEVKPKPVATGTRLVSLDAFRGFIMFWIVGGSSVVLGLQALGHNRVIDTIVYHLNHSAWEGLRFYDCIWPSFMLMVGVSIPFSYAKRSLTQTHSQMLGHAVRRFCILMLLGGIRESVSLDSPRLIELSSALQPIALASLAAFLLVRKSWKFQAAVGALILLGYLLLLALVPVPGVGEVSYRHGANLVYAVDKALLPHRTGEAVFLEGWGTIICTIPTIATTILGLLLGQLLRSQQPAMKKAKVMALIGVSGLALGYVVSLFVPVVMKMWTTSYGILSASWACLMFLLFYWIIDVLGYRKWSFVFVVIGMNALAVYLCSTFTRLPQVVGIFTKAPAAAMGSFGPLSAALAFFAVEWSILYWMYKRKLFLSA
jgi:predicted acyltransferase